MGIRKLFSVSVTYLVVLFVTSLFMIPFVQAGPEEALHLGATVAFQSRIGIQLKNILYMNADLLNKAGGLTVGGKTYRIEYHIYDDKYQADPARAAIEKLVFEDKVKFNVGTFASASTLAMLGVTEPNKIPIFGGAVSEKLLSPDVKYFVHCYPGKFSFTFLKTLKELRPNIKNVIMCTYDDETGHSLVPPLEKAYKSFGIEPLPALYFKHGETDFSRIATKVVSLRPDHFNLFGVMVEAENVQCIKALRQAGYKGTIEGYYISQHTVDEIVSKVGKEGAEGIHVGIFDPTFPGLKEIPEGAMDFRKNYEKYYGTWETEGLQWAGSWYTWLAAVKRADSLDPDKVIAAITKDFKVSTPVGQAKFFRRPDLGNNRYCDFATVVRSGVIQNGKIVFLFEKDADYAIGAIEDVYNMKMR